MKFNYCRNYISNPTEKFVLIIIINSSIVENNKSTINQYYKVILNNRLDESVLKNKLEKCKIFRMAQQI